MKKVFLNSVSVVMVLGLTLTATSCDLFSSKTAATTDSLNVKIEDSLQVDSLATPIDSINEQVDSVSKEAGVIQDASEVKVEEPKVK
jgi:hypothetical protein